MSHAQRASGAISLAEQRDAFLSALAARPLVMGILNVTPDSFSDGGRFAAHDDAFAQALVMEGEGADVIDIGAESTRPGHAPLDEAQELQRLDGVFQRIIAATSAPVSIDTTKAAVARWACARGACIINDVWGLQKDPAMADAVAETGAALVIMHNRAEKDETIDIIDDLRRFFDRSLALADKAGVPRERILLDPGNGFGKTMRQNLEVVSRIGELRDYGLPVLLGVSRKSFLSQFIEGGTEARLVGTIAANLAGLACGARVFRVHDVKPHVEALRVYQGILATGRTS